MNKKWLKAAAIRAIKTVAQTAAAIMSTSAMLESCGNTSDKNSRSNSRGNNEYVCNVE